MLDSFATPPGRSTYNDPAMLLGNNSKTQIWKHRGGDNYHPRIRPVLSLGWKLTPFQYDMTRVTANCLSWQCDLSINYFVLIIREKVKIVILRRLLLLPSNQHAPENGEGMGSFPEGHRVDSLTLSLCGFQTPMRGHDCSSGSLLPVPWETSDWLHPSGR